jgi:hypothetical protein
VTYVGSNVPPDPKLLAEKARAKAEHASEQVRYLRVLLGHAMREEQEALAAAREAEQAAARS